MTINIDAGRATTLAAAAPYIDLADVQLARGNATLVAASGTVDVDPDPNDDADCDGECDA